MKAPPLWMTTKCVPHCGNTKQLARARPACCCFNQASRGGGALCWGQQYHVVICHSREGTFPPVRPRHVSRGTPAHLSESKQHASKQQALLLQFSKSLAGLVGHVDSVSHYRKDFHYAPKLALARHCAQKGWHAPKLSMHPLSPAKKPLLACAQKSTAGHKTLSPILCPSLPVPNPAITRQDATWGCWVTVFQHLIPSLHPHSHITRYSATRGCFDTIRLEPWDTCTAINSIKALGGCCMCVWLSCVLPSPPVSLA